jgi:hypothetical protein
MNLASSSLFSQLLSFIHRNRFAKLVRETGTERRSKGFASWDHFVAMLFCQLAQARSLREFDAGLSSCEGTSIRHARDDAKIRKAADTVKAWLKEGLNPVIFCQYIPTATYVGEVLRELLPTKIDVQVVTSEDPDDVRRDRIDAMKVNGDSAIRFTSSRPP